jgi:hypothetical protein
VDDIWLTCADQRFQLVQGKEIGVRAWGRAKPAQLMHMQAHSRGTPQ